MPWRLSISTRNTTGDALLDSLDAGTIQVRTGAQPTSPNSAATGILLATLSFSAEAFVPMASGRTSANAISSDTNIDATGTASWARLLNGDGTTHSDMDVGEGGGTLSFDDADFIAGGTAQITSMNITMPES